MLIVLGLSSFGNNQCTVSWGTLSTGIGDEQCFGAAGFQGYFHGTHQRRRTCLPSKSSVREFSQRHGGRPVGFKNKCLYIRKE